LGTSISKMTNPPKIMHSMPMAPTTLWFSFTCYSVRSSMGRFNSLKNLSTFAWYSGGDFS
jgi:hypothetical protein